MSGGVVLGAVALLLVLLLCPVVWAVLRPRSRARIAALPGRTVALLAALSALGPAFVAFAPIRLTMRLDGALQLIGALLASLLAFALVVAAPVAALLAAAVWLTARRRVA